jgi:uncharacterized protein (DUF2342 family)
VADDAGFGALDAAWHGAESLPTLDELRTPARWLERVGVGGPAATSAAGS